MGWGGLRCLDLNRVWVEMLCHLGKRMAGVKKKFHMLVIAP